VSYRPPSRRPGADGRLLDYQFATNTEWVNPYEFKCGLTRPSRSDALKSAPVPVTQPERIRLLVEQLEQARARIGELEAERERTEAVHRDLIRRAQAAMRETVA
jgi:hypothetical protein